MSSGFGAGGFFSCQVSNPQRFSLIAYLLGQPPTNPAREILAMQDEVYQLYRAKIIPGPTEIITQVDHASHPGVLSAGYISSITRAFSPEGISVLIDIGAGLTTLN